MTPAAIRSARRNAGRHRAALAGACVCQVPFGYARPPRQRRHDPAPTIVPHPVEADMVRRIFREFRLCRSLARLAARLRADGVRTRAGNEWSRAALGLLLRNPIYVGQVRYSGRTVAGRHEAIVARIVFNLAGGLLTANRRRPGP